MLANRIEEACLEYFNRIYVNKMDNVDKHPKGEVRKKFVFQGSSLKGREMKVEALKKVSKKHNLDSDFMIRLLGL